MRYLEYLGTQSNTTAIIAMVISVISLIASIAIGILNYRRKRFESHAMYRSQILVWYHDVANLLCILPRNLEAPELGEQLAKLSALIDQGRFYFPNEITEASGESDEQKMSSAFQGKRDRAIMMLEWYHDIVRRDNVRDYLDYLDDLQKMFTSRIFDVLKPREFNELAGHVTSLSTASLSEEDNLDEMLQRSLEDFKEALAGIKGKIDLTSGQRLARKLFNEIAVKDLGRESRDEKTASANEEFSRKGVQRVRLAQGAGRGITLYFDKENDVPNIYLAAGGKDGEAPFPSVCHFKGKNEDRVPKFLREYKKEKRTVSMLLDDARMEEFIKELKNQIDANKDILK